MTHIESVRVSASSRLHFGLLSFGEGRDRQYGGLGAMIDQPRVVLTARRGERLDASGPFRNAAIKYATRVLAYLDEADSGVHIDIQHAARPHVGLGTGTQVGLSVARALFELFDQGDHNAIDFARASGRGRRSAIGTHGFVRGGMIYEEGKRHDEDLAPLSARVELPGSWRFMLLIPAASEGLSGAIERDAFDRLPPVPHETTERLRRIATEEIIPAAERADIAAFGDAVYRYGYTSGMCFAQQQSGAFSSNETQHIVDTLRAAGIQGVGQSSWGPTVFALIEAGDAEEALRLGNSLMPDDASQVLIAAPDHIGAVSEKKRVA